MQHREIYKMKWPIEVQVPSHIGRYDYRVCAVGRARRALGLPADVAFEKFTKKAHKWSNAYKRVAVHLNPRSNLFEDIEALNDKMPDKHRTLAYNTAWALCGYTEGQSKAVLDLAKEVGIK